MYEMQKYKQTYLRKCKETITFKRETYIFDIPDNLQSCLKFYVSQNKLPITPMKQQIR